MPSRRDRCPRICAPAGVRRNRREPRRRRDRSGHAAPPGEAGARGGTSDCAPNWCKATVRSRLRTKQKYPGLVPFETRFSTRIHAVGRRWNCGTWDTEKEAAVAIHRARLYLRVERPLFFPALARRLGAASPAALYREAKLKTKRSGKRGTSRYLGVYWYERDRLWKASIHHGGR